MDIINNNILIQNNQNIDNIIININYFWCNECPLYANFIQLNEEQKEMVLTYIQTIVKNDIKEKEIE